MAISDLKILALIATKLRIEAKLYSYTHIDSSLAALSSSFKRPSLHRDSSLFIFEEFNKIRIELKEFIAFPRTQIDITK